MKAKIKTFDCIDHDPIDKWIPPNKNDISIWIAFRIGPEKNVGAEFFCTHFVTPNNIPNDLLKRYFVIEEYEFDKICKIIERIVNETIGNNWEEIGKSLNKYIEWEFDNYQHAT